MSQNKILTFVYFGQNETKRPFLENIGSINYLTTGNIPLKLLSSHNPKEKCFFSLFSCTEEVFKDLPKLPCSKNEVIPYVGSILRSLLPGELIVIHGSIPDDADRFQVDLQCGSSIKPRADVAFHFNPRFKRSGCIVCNTLQGEKWGSEEITYEMPFQKGKPFKIVFMVLKDKFQVAVNGKHLLLYKHRIDLEKIDTLGIYGKVQIEIIEFVSNKSLQGSQPSSLGITKINTENGAVPDGSQFAVPYLARLNSALGPGCTVTIKGEVNKNPNSFTINLKSSNSDIALHLNPRMKNKVFVRNSYLHDSWGEEEKEVAHFPFSPGMYFELIIFCDAHEFKVAINGVHILKYKHRFKQLDMINLLEITGDIELLDVRSW